MVEGLAVSPRGARAWWSPRYPIRLPGTKSDQRVRTARMTARQVLVKGRVHKARVVHGDQQAQAPKRVGGRRPGRGGAGGTEVGGGQNGVREDRRREESSRSTTASDRDACHERTGCHRRRCQARDRLPVPYRRESLPQGGTARTQNDGDVYACVEVADRPPLIIRPRPSHNEEYAAPQSREALPNEDIAAARLPSCSRWRRIGDRIGDGPRVRRQPLRRSDRQARARPASTRRDPRDARKGAANSPSAEIAAKLLEGDARRYAHVAAPRRSQPGAVARRGDCLAEASDSSACPVRSAAERLSRSLGRELVVEEQRHLGVGDAGDRPERVAGAGGEDVGVRRR